DKLQKNDGKRYIILEHETFGNDVDWVVIEADMPSYQIFEQLEQVNIECGYIARDNKVAKKYVLRNRENIINLEDKLYLCVRKNS
ncbi:hypothetical protein BU009_13375, partial [Mammaliicoccus sciuri]|uniref:hypothetical protein n=2 Tax=Mammaliicoccus sciuri TaxID=1296 RepID=UPI000D43558E